jgi:cob(I)alamin adenosyltransferase
MAGPASGQRYPATLASAVPPRDGARRGRAPDRKGADGDESGSVASGMPRERIYTRTGDDGTTGLLFGGRVGKDSEHPAAYGTVDEVQAVLGLARAHSPAAGELSELLIVLERDLWVLMSELATLPENRRKLTPGTSLVSQEMVDRLEHTIDELDTRFEPPTEFVVPGETVLGAWLDLARVVTRRAERLALPVAPPPSLAVVYLNRLSDLLWTIARWQEGQSRLTRSVADPDAVPDVDPDAASLADPHEEHE